MAAPPRPVRDMRIVLICIAALVLLFLALPLVNGSLQRLSAPGGPFAPPTPTTVEYRLAALSAGQPLAADDPSVARIAFLLNDLSRLCLSDRATIARLTEDRWQALHARKPEVRLLNVLESAHSSAMVVPGQPYDHVLDTVIALSYPVPQTP